MLRPFLLLLASAVSLSAADVIRLPGEARFFLKVPAGNPALTDLSVSTGTATNSNWEKDPEAAKRQKDIRFAVRWWAWQEMTVTFTPTYDGPLDLVLNGMWSKDAAGNFHREEVLWDDITATGLEVANGGFETQTGTSPDGWTYSWKNDLPATEWPLAGAEARTGSKVAASWHNRPLEQKLTVKAGQKVTLTLHAKAATPPDFATPKRHGKDTPAHKAAAKLKRGVNLGNCWEVGPPYQWKVPHTPADIDLIAAEGFDHIRIPVAWHFHLIKKDSGMEIAPELLAELEPVVRRALEKNLRILLDWHHFYDLDKDPAGNKQRFIEGWNTIATHFKDSPEGLYFELLNEPHDNLSTEILNPIQAEAIATIRKTNPTRTIVLSPGDWGKVTEFDKLLLPDDDTNIIVTFHCYEPFFFTHQNSGWTHLGPLKGVVYPGPPATPLAVPEKLKGDSQLSATIAKYNTLTGDENPSSVRIIKSLMDMAVRWSDFFGRPVHLGEFGAIDTADAESRVRYVRDARTAAETRGIPWTLWDWKAKFHYWDQKTGQPLLRSAIFE